MVSDIEVFRPKGGVALAATSFGIGALSVGSLVFASKWVLLPGALSIWFAASVILYALMVRPKVVVARAGITVVNPIRTIDLPWSAIEQLDNRYALTIATATAKFTAWAAIAPSRYQARRIDQSDLKSTYLSNRTLIRAADSPLSETGGVMMLAEYWKRELGTHSEVAPVSIRFDWLTIGLLVAAVVVIAVALGADWL